LSCKSKLLSFLAGEKKLEFGGLKMRTPNVLSLFLVCLAAFNGLLQPYEVQASNFTIPESELLTSEFNTKAWGPASVVRTDATGDAVDFAFADLTTSSTGLKDNYPVATVYGQTIPSHGNGDFSVFSGYALKVENLDAQAVGVSIFINTGFTGPSGTPSNNPANDTFWQSSWIEILPGQISVLQLNFDNAIPWSIGDNPSPHTQGTNSIATSINSFDRTEVSAIGFQIYGPSGNSAATIRISPIPEPATIGLLALGGLMIRRMNRKS
jgi:hypothetical protein